MSQHLMTRRSASVALFAAVLAAGSTSVLAEPAARKAPEWEISEWINSPGLTLAGLAGKVVVIDFFQLWCPGCNSFSIPLMHHWEQVFATEAAAGEIQFVSIHTVFEGHGYQRPERLRQYLREKGITHPVGVDRHLDGRRVPETMRRYGTRGTPEMAIIDRRGNLRFQRFGFFEPAVGEAMVRRLLAEEVPGAPGQGSGNLRPAGRS